MIARARSEVQLEVTPLEQVLAGTISLFAAGGIGAGVLKWLQDRSKSKHTLEVKRLELTARTREIELKTEAGLEEQRIEAFGNYREPGETTQEMFRRWTERIIAIEQREEAAGEKLDECEKGRVKDKRERAEELAESKRKLRVVEGHVQELQAQVKRQHSELLSMRRAISPHQGTLMYRATIKDGNEDDGGER